MIRTLALLAALTPAAAFADAAPPALGDLKMVLVNGMNSFDTMALPAVLATDCQTSDGGGLTVSKCAVANATFTVKAASGDATTVPIDSLIYMVKTGSSAGTLLEYHYKGHWSRTVDGVPLASDTELVVWFYQQTPDDLHGFISLTKYNRSQSFTAVRVTH